MVRKETGTDKILHSLSLVTLCLAHEAYKISTAYTAVNPSLLSSLSRYQDTSSCHDNVSLDQPRLLRP